MFVSRCWLWSVPMFVTFSWPIFHALLTSIHSLVDVDDVVNRRPPRIETRRERLDAWIPRSHYDPGATLMGQWSICLQHQPILCNSYHEITVYKSPYINGILHYP